MFGDDEGSNLEMRLEEKSETLIPSHDTTKGTLSLKENVKATLLHR
jgi:hypothetical protein